MIKMSDIFQHGDVAIVVECGFLGCQYEVNHNTHGADCTTDKLNDKTLGLYLVCCHYRLL